MLLAVEGGGFFSSSASGYTNGLTLLLLGRRNEEKPMRVSPWNQYQLVEQAVDPDPHLASKKTQASCGCSSFICFNCVPAGLDGQSPPKVGPINQSETLSDTSSSNRGKGTSNDSVDENQRKVCLRSSLKKRFTDCSVIAEGDHARDSLEEVQGNISCCTQRRRVQWTDACGRELAEIREFEISDDYPSDDDSEHGVVRRCECVIQ